jgi:hypothetical protein
VTCAPSKAPPTDAGVTSCATDADCEATGSGLQYCRQNQCVFDQCLTDTDCANGGVCGCSTDYYGGNAAFHPNVCVAAACHVDSDCGAGGLCAPSFGYCGSFDSFQCGSSTAGSCSTQETCSYSQEVGRFVCGPATACSG